MDKHGSYVVSGSVADNATSISAEVVPEATHVTFDISGASFSGITLNFEFSLDGGTTYRALECVKTGDSTGKSAAPTGLGAAIAYQAQIPAGATHVRARSSAYSTGPATVKVAQAKRA